VLLSVEEGSYEEGLSLYRCSKVYTTSKTYAGGHTKWLPEMFPTRLHATFINNNVETSNHTTVQIVVCLLKLTATKASYSSQIFKYDPCFQTF
jgi:hypothetical protein